MKEYLKVMKTKEHMQASKSLAKANWGGMKQKDDKGGKVSAGGKASAAMKKAEGGTRKKGK
jgi:hypothetical protein